MPLETVEPLASGTLVRGNLTPVSRGLPVARVHREGRNVDGRVRRIRQRKQRDALRAGLHLRRVGRTNRHFVAERCRHDGGEDIDTLRELVGLDPVGGGPPWDADHEGRIRGHREVSLLVP